MTQGPSPTLPKPRDPQAAFKADLEAVLGDLANMLIAKNRKYGDAALNPKQTFSKCDPLELINVRMDDKLNRIANRQTDEDEDPEKDLLGYLVIKQIAKLRKSASEMPASLRPPQPMPSMPGSPYSRD